MNAVLLCLAIGLALLLRAERQVDDRDAELDALREMFLNAREDAAYQRKQLIAATRERDQLARDAYLHETWTIGGGEVWAA